MNLPDHSTSAYLLRRTHLQRGLVFGSLIIAALLAFEIFNYSTTDYALGDLLGNLRFAGVPWSTILAIAFCGIDFAGIARLFTPIEGGDEPAETWYLFGAWMLAATMNATLTWWGVSLAIVEHQSIGSGVVIDRNLLLKVVPVFVAIMVWVIRVLIIGTFSVAGDRLFSQSSVKAAGPRLSFNRQNSAARPSSYQSPRPASAGLARSSAPAPSFKTATKPGGARASFLPENDEPEEPPFARPEPTYHPMPGSGRPDNGNGNSQNRRQF